MESITPFFGTISGSIAIVVKGLASIGTEIVGLVIVPLLGTILKIGRITRDIRTVLSVSLSIMRSRKVSSKGKK